MMATWQDAAGDREPAAQRRRGSIGAVPTLVTGLLLAALAIGGLSGSGQPPATTGPEELDIERLQRGDDPLRDLPVVGGAAQPHGTTASWTRPDRGRWRRLPAAPIGGRVGHTLAAVGSVVIAWGGYLDERAMGNGALFDARTGRWERIPDSPVAESGHLPVVAGNHLLLLHEQRPQAYDVVRRRWERLPAPKLPRAVRMLRLATSTGRVAVVATADRFGRAGPLLAYDALDKRWTLLPAPPTPLSIDHALVWNGHDLLLLGRSATASADGFLHRLPFPADPGARDPGATWEPAPGPPLDGEAAATSGVRAVSAGNGGPVYVWVDFRFEVEEDARLLVYTGAPDGAAWRDLGVVRLDDHYPTMLWTGRDVLAVGHDAVLSYRPETGATTYLPGTELMPHQQRKAAWAGELLVWWGGVDGDGAAWAPVPTPSRSTLTRSPSGRACSLDPLPGCHYGDR